MGNFALWLPAQQTKELKAGRLAKANLAAKA